MSQKILPKLKVFICSLIYLLLIAGCSSHKKVNQMASELNCNKSFYFSLNEDYKSVPIELNGPYIGKADSVNYKEAFIKSINSLNEDYANELKYVQKFGLPENSVIQVKVSIKSIHWDFTHTTGTLISDLIYETPSRRINVVGKNKVYISGTNRGNLYKSMKDCNYQFLKEYCLK